MADETKVSERNGAPEAAPKGLVRDVGELAHDAWTLVELQAQLFSADMQELGRRPVVPALILLGGLALVVAGFPMALIALALLLVQVLPTSYPVGFLLAAVIGAMCGGLLCIIGWRQVRKRLAVLQRSQQELARNLNWIKQILERRRTTRGNNSRRTVI